MISVKEYVATHLESLGWIKDVGRHPGVARKRHAIDGMVKDTIAYVHEFPDCQDFYILSGSHIEGGLDSMQMRNLLSHVRLYIPKSATTEEMRITVASFALAVDKALSESFVIRKAA